MRNPIAGFFSSCLLLLSLDCGVQAQTSTAVWSFPVVDNTTINWIDTIYFQWTSNYELAFLYFWCQNGQVTGNDVVLASSFSVDTSGRYAYVLSKEAPKETEFPVACHAQLVPTPGGPGVDGPVGVTFSSKLNVAPETFSLTTSASTTSAAETSTEVSTSKIATVQSTTPTQGVAATTSAAPQTSSETRTQISTGTTMITIPTTTTSSTQIDSSKRSTTTSAGGPTTSTSSTFNVTKSVSTSNNLGAIIGGVIGGTFLICFIIFGALFLRKYNRLNNNPESRGGNSMVRRNSSRWWRRRSYRTTPMQTGGLHEKDGSGIPKKVFEKEGDNRHRVFEKEGSVPKRPLRPQTILAELPS